MKQPVETNTPFLSPQWSRKPVSCGTPDILKKGV